MAKGKLSLLDTTAPDDIILTNEETGSIPYFDIDGEYGVAEGYASETLVVKKRANKKGKVDLGENPDKVYSYEKWDELKYPSTFDRAIEIYAETKLRNLNKTLIKSTDLKDIRKNQLEVQAIIKKALNINIMDGEIIEACSLINTIQYMKKQIEETIKLNKELVSETKKLREEIKESRQIIVDMKPKKVAHKVKLED